MRVKVSTRGLDVTSVAPNVEYGPAQFRFGKTVLDMTPARVGELGEPTINTEQIVESSVRRITMMACGGHAPVPIASANMTVQDDVDNIEAASIGQLVWPDSSTSEDSFQGTIEVKR